MVSILLPVSSRMAFERTLNVLGAVSWHVVAKIVYLTVCLLLSFVSCRTAWKQQYGSQPLEWLPTSGGRSRASSNMLTGGAAAPPVKPPAPPVEPKSGHWGGQINVIVYV